MKFSQMQGAPNQSVCNRTAGGIRCLAASASWLLLVTSIAGCGDSNNLHIPERAGASSALANSQANAELPTAKPVRFVKLEQLTEWTGNSWASIAELGLIDSTGATVDRTRWAVSADSSGIHDPPANAVDGDPNTVWHTQWDGHAPPPPHALTIDLAVPVKISGFRYLPRQDRVENGTIAKYRFYVSADGLDWGQAVSTGDFSSIGPASLEKTVIFAEQTDNHPPLTSVVPSQATPLGQSVSVQVVASDADADVLSYESNGLPRGLSMSSATGLITGTPISPGQYVVSVGVSDGKGSKTTVAFDWAVGPPVSNPDLPKAAPGEVRFVKLEQVSEINGSPWGSIAELNLLDATGTVLRRTGWTVSADSADANDKPGNAIDGIPGSHWHSQWNGTSPQPPHVLVIDLGTSTKLRGFRYLPRQDASSNGMIAKFRFYTSVDGTRWGRPVADGDFSAMDGAPKSEKTVLFR